MLYTGEQPMKPEKISKKVLSVTQAKAKMLEYSVPIEYQELDFSTDPKKLFSLTIGLLGDYSYKLNQPEISKDELEECKTALRFSSRFFDAYIQSKMNTTLDDYLILLGSATYYLCDLTGNSIVLLKRLNGKSPELNADGLEKILFWLLNRDVPDNNNDFTGIYRNFLQAINEYFNNFIRNGVNEQETINILNDFRIFVYANGSDRCLLFVDVIVAVIKRKIENSCWKALPYYSALNIDIWKSTIQRANFIKEFWPAQHLMGEKDVLKGKSAVIQMPTSAGKTKATEIIIRSAFLSERTSMAVIIAPFRALCHEINNDLTRAFKNEKINVIELNDVLQMDIATDQLQGDKQILVVTPEKLFYILSHNKDIALLSNLFIFDEGHQFDNGSRGITYELLLTTLLLFIQENTQKVLISAVINNSEQISKWLNKEINVVSGEYLSPTFKSVGFVSWIYQLGQIHYINEDNNEEEDFFVPRVIEQFQLEKLGKEKKESRFPEKNDSQSIALFLGLKLVSNGSVAIFCGRKDSVTKMCKKLIDIIQRGFFVDTLNLLVNKEEVERLAQLYFLHLGNNSIAGNSAKNGVFSHHNNIPHGIRIAVEHAMRENMISFIICTSTLAQGVNLPIKYLIISSYNQGGEYIKNRDFHNLIGRVGRSGMHTEGSILFTNPEIYDGRYIFRKRWLWEKVQELLDRENGEPCLSQLSVIFEPLKDIDGNNKKTLKMDIFLEHYFNSPDLVDRLIENILDNNHDEFTKESLEQQFLLKINLISAIENFMLSNWDELEVLKGEDTFSNIVTKTLGYSLAGDEIRRQLSELFNIIEENIRTKISEPEKRKVYGKTLYGIRDAVFIEEWFNNNIQALLSANSEENLLDVIWSILKDIFIKKTNLKLINIENLKLVMNGWISGIPYDKVMSVFHENEIMIKWGEKTRKINIDKVVDICDNVFSFDGCLVLNAIYEFATQNDDENQGMMLLLQKLQKRLKYGLPDETSIVIYEIGFCDRVIAQDIKNTLNINSTDKLEIIYAIKVRRDLAKTMISKYPAYYQMKMDNLIN
jgi:superfamily II DNA/RNA helicase